MDRLSAEFKYSIPGFYKCLSDELIAFLRDLDDTDYAKFENTLNNLVTNGEIDRFCDFFLRTYSETDLYLFIQGILETDVDIYSGDWYSGMLQSISQSAEISLPLRQTAQVILHEYYEL